MNPIYNLIEISEWSKNKLVTLPNVQRGFVWKASQIENLWDSLLRGYPVGSFVLSPKSSNDSKYEILDGQQRATAICLGFENETFKKETIKKYKLFIDLEFPDSQDNREYVFRVITKSHPWGYNKKDNSKTLTAEEKRNAIERFKKENWLNEELDSFFPIDASLPIPFKYFIDAALSNYSLNDLIESIENQWLDGDGNRIWDNLKTDWYKRIQKISENLNKDAFKKSLEISDNSKINKRIGDIYTDVLKMLVEQKIPTLYLDFEKLKQRKLFVNTEPISFLENENISIESEELKESDAIENLFIRLNSGGTVLSGEELNYSILKSSLVNISLISDIEKACGDFIQPSRFITLVYKLFQKENKKRENLSIRIKPKQFQRTISENKTGKSFEDYIERIIFNKEYDNKTKTFLEYIVYFLEYNAIKGHGNGLPHLIVCRIAQSTPEIMLMLFYRIKIHKDEFIYGGNDHCKALGLITYLMWLGKGEKQRDHSKVLSNIWPAVESLPYNKFWSSATIKRAQLYKTLIAAPRFTKSTEANTLYKSIKSPKSNTSIWDRIFKNSRFYDFANTMFYERDLVLYAQRKFLADIFKNQEFHQEDTNMPFDWDHISPSKFIYSKKGIPKVIKDTYATIGNLRAWPYILNRSDQAVVPALKFDPIGNKPLDRTDSQYEKICFSWLKFVESNQDIIKDLSLLKTSLLTWSFCEDKKWLTLDSDDMKKNWHLTYELIMNRNMSLIKSWYKDLHIDELLKFNETDPSVVLNKVKWKLLPKKLSDKEIKEDLFVEDFNVWVYKQILNTNGIPIIYFYQFSNDEERILAENYFYFGIFCKQEYEFIKSIKISDKLKNTYTTNNKNYVYGNFTLISHDFESYLKLLEDINEWLIDLPFAKNLKTEINSTFFNSITLEYKKQRTLSK